MPPSTAGGHKFTPEVDKLKKQIGDHEASIAKKDQEIFQAQLQVQLQAQLTAAKTERFYTQAFPKPSRA